MRKLNLGCGYKKLDGYLNVDNYYKCTPDYLYNLEDSWPWASDSFIEVQAIHSLEHMKNLIHIMEETYRVLKPDGLFTVEFPDPRSDSWWGDPTHVTPITPQVLSTFSQRINKHTLENGGSNSTLGLELGIDFEQVSANAMLTPRWLHLKDRPMAEAEYFISSYNNVVGDWRVVMRAIKPAGSLYI